MMVTCVKKTSNLAKNHIALWYEQFELIVEVSQIVNYMF